MTAWPHDDTASKNAFYGNFQAKGWFEAHTTRIAPKFQMYYAGHAIQSILVNKACAAAMLAAFAEIAEKCQFKQNLINGTGASDFGGCYNPRRIAGSSNWSNHSWACAIDLSPRTNGFNMKGTLSSIVIDAFKRQGFRWGGDYKGRKDPMHFEAVHS